MKNPKLILNKWQYGFSGGWHHPWGYGFRPWIAFWVFCLKRFPNEGNMLSPDDYKGFYKDISFLPSVITMRRWTFRIPIKLRIFLRLFNIKSPEIFSFNLPTKKFRKNDR